jgi:hypothetical protein
MLKLAHLTAFWPRTYTCELFKLGPDTLKDIAAVPEKRQCVLLLDALDEDPEALGRINARLQEVLEATVNFRRVIITCRTQFFPGKAAGSSGGPEQVVVGGFSCPMIFVSLFNEQQVTEYLKKRYPRRWYHFLPLIANKPQVRASVLLKKMGSLKMRPLLLAHIEDLVAVPDRKWNEYAVFDALVTAWLNREYRKLRRTYGDETPSVAELRLACISLAEQMQLGGDRRVAAAELEKLVARNLPWSALHSFDIGGRTLLNRDAAGFYRFSHYSLQEFLVASGLSVGAIVSSPPMTQLIAMLVVQSELTTPRSNPLDLRGLIAPSAWLVRACLNGAELGEANLTSANLTSANLTSTKFVNAVLTGAILTGANLSSANLRGAQLEKADLRGAKLIGANLAACILAEANLSGADLQGADLQNADLRDADLRGADLRYADLTGANLIGTNVTDAKFEGSKGAQQGLLESG